MANPARFPILPLPMPEKPTDHLDALRKKTSSLPKEPGIYRFYDVEGKLLYVGKAKVLRNRVKSYFQKSADHAPKTLRMLQKITDFDWVTTTSEIEALILESNLIHENRPPFNVLLRDDKHFLYIKITRDPFPLVSFVRQLEEGKATYFGPYAKASEVRKTIDFLREVLRFRTCRVEISPEGKTIRNPENRKIPCLDYQIHRCTAPCDAKITQKEYADDIRQLTQFLRGNTTPVKKKLHSEMLVAAENKEFERAARFRDLVKSIEWVDNKQSVSIPADFSADVIGMAYGEGKSFFHVLFVRHGKVLRSENFSIPSAATAEETYLAFLRDHFAFFPDVPAITLVSDVFPEVESSLWEEFASHITEKKTEIRVPKRSVKRELLELAEKNAELQAVNSKASFEEDVLGRLQKALKLPRRPERIECYDVSHLSGTHPVGSRVVFINGEPAKSEYRKYKMKTLPTGKIDDFASMKELVGRRLKRLERGSEILETIEITDEEKIADIDAMLVEGHLLTGLPTDQQYEFRETITGKIVGYARTRSWGRSIEIGGLVVLPEFQASGMGTEIIKAMVLQSTEKYVRVFVRRKKLRWVVALKSIGFAEEKEPPKGLKELIELKKTEEGIERFVMKISPENLRQAVNKVPDLLVIDGGKGQLSVVVSVLRKMNLYRKIPVCSLAKKEEQVFVPGDPKPLPISKSSPENELLQRIRDEAHRFAISFNKRLRKKAEITSILDDVSGIGKETKKKLLNEYGSTDAIFAANDRSLLRHVSPKTLHNLRKARQQQAENDTTEREDMA